MSYFICIKLNKIFIVEIFIANILALLNKYPSLSPPLPFSVVKAKASFKPRSSGDREERNFSTKPNILLNYLILKNY